MKASETLFRKELGANTAVSLVLNGVLFYSALVLQGKTLHAAEDVRITNQELGFSFAIPAGFADRGIRTAKARDILYAYQNSQSDLAFIILRTHRVIVQRGVDNSSLRKGLNLQMETALWKECTIDAGTVTYTTSKGAHMYELDAFIPLRSECISLQVAGPVEHADLVRIQFNWLLNSVQGETNWDSPDGQYPYGEYWSGYRVGQAVVYVLAFIGCIYLIRRRIMRRRRRQMR